MKHKLLLIAGVLIIAFVRNVSAQWMQAGLTLETNKTITNVSTMASSGTTLFAATNLGVIVSTDNGGSWSEANTGLPSGVNSIQIIGTSVLAGTNTGIFLSNNNGSSWSALSLIDTTVHTLAISGTNILAGTNVGVALSTNVGTSWELLTDMDVIVLTLSGTNIYAATSNGVIHSFDNGGSWQYIPANLSINTIISNGMNLFAGTSNNGIFLSKDSGTSWTSASNGLMTPTIHAFAASDTNIFAALDDGVYRSTNEGTSWNLVDSGVSMTSVNSFVVSGANIFAGTSTGSMFQSTDKGTNWTKINNSLLIQTGLDVNVLTVSGTNLFAGTGDSGIYLSTDLGNNWTPENTGLTGLGNGVRAFAVSGTNLFASISNIDDDGNPSGSGVFLSTNNGTTWTGVNKGLPSDAYIPALCACDTALFAATEIPRSCVTYRTTDNGTTWAAINTGLPSGDDNFTYVTAFAVIGSNLFAGTGNAVAGFFTGNGVFLSTNNGTWWNPASLDLPENSYVSALAVIDTLLFAGISDEYGNTINISTDSGAYWYAANLGLLSGGIITALAVSGLNIFAATSEGGVYISTNNGTSWESAGSGLPPTTSVVAFAVVGSNLFAGTDNFGVWHRPLSDFDNLAVEPVASLGNSVTSYPNPFTQSTTVTFSSQTAGYAEVTVVNLLGAQVAQLFSGELSAGEHSFPWNASGMAPGLYECIVRMNGQVQRISMSHLE